MCANSRWVCVSLAGVWLMLGAVWKVLDHGWFALASAAVGFWYVVVALTRKGDPDDLGT